MTVETARASRGVTPSLGHCSGGPRKAYLLSCLVPFPPHGCQDFTSLSLGARCWLVTVDHGEK